MSDYINPEKDFDQILAVRKKIVEDCKEFIFPRLGPFSENMDKALEDFLAGADLKPPEPPSDD